MATEIQNKMSFDEIRYSNVWEDSALREAGLEVRPDDTVLSIGSAGCNSFALLLMGAAKVVAVDLSPAQCALIRLKVAGVRALAHGDFLCLLGLSEERPATDVYARLADDLDDETRRFWDARQDVLTWGIVHCGKLDRYFKTFRDEHLVPMIGKQTVSSLFSAQTAEEQLAAASSIVTPDMRAKVRWYFSQDVMQVHGRDPAQFAHVTQNDIGSGFFNSFTRTCTELPTKGNCYLEMLLSGECADYELGPAYLRPSEFKRLKGLLGRLEVRQCGVEDYLQELPDGSLGKANLSDIFEYMSEAGAAAVFELLARKLRPGGRAAYWNMLVPRRRPERLSAFLQPLEEMSTTLTHRDRTPFYSAFRVDERV